MSTSASVATFSLPLLCVKSPSDLLLQGHMFPNFLIKIHVIGLRTHWVIPDKLFILRLLTWLHLQRPFLKEGNIYRFQGKGHKHVSFEVTIQTTTLNTIFIRLRIIFLLYYPFRNSICRASLVAYCKELTCLWEVIDWQNSLQKKKKIIYHDQVKFISGLQYT